MKKIILSIVMAISAFSIKITAQVGIQTSNPQGVFNIDAAKDNPATGAPTTTQQANDISVTATGNMGIGTTTPNAPLQFGNSTMSRKIVMFETANNDNEFYGFGVNSGIMRYQADRTTTDHVFYAGVTGGASSNELMRVKGTGNVGIGVSAPLAKLHVEGTEVRLSNATSLWGLAPEGTSPTSQFSFIDRTSNVRRLILQENGNAYLGGTLGTA